MVIHFKSAFENLSEKDVDEFIKLNKNKPLWSSTAVFLSICKFYEKKNKKSLTSTKRCATLIN